MEKKDVSLFIRMSEKELDAINGVWFEAVKASGRPISKSEFIRGILAAYVARYWEEHNEYE